MNRSNAVRDRDPYRITVGDGWILQREHLPFAMLFTHQYRLYGNWPERKIDEIALWCENLASPYTFCIIELAEGILCGGSSTERGRRDPIEYSKEWIIRFFEVDAVLFEMTFMV